MKVCHVIQNTDIGGAETALLRLLQQTATVGIDSSVISLIGCGPVGDKIREAKIPFHALGMSRSTLQSPACLWRLRKLLCRSQPDLVQTWTYHADLLGGLAAWSARIPCVWNVRHGTLDRQIDSRNTLRSAAYCARLSYRLPRAIVVNSYAAVHVHRAVGYAANKMHVISNGFDTNVFRPSSAAREQLRCECNLLPDTLLIGTCGRFHAHKGFADFVRMAGIVAKRLAAESTETADRQLQFVMIGKDCDIANAELVGWIRQAGLSDRFRLLGVRHDMEAVLAGLDIYVQSSVTEGMPNSVGEAMACSIPVVVTDVGDCARLVDSPHFVVPSRHPELLAERVLSLLAATNAYRQACGARGRERIVSEYSLQATTQKYLDLWSTVRQDCSTQRLPTCTHASWRIRLRGGASPDTTTVPGTHLQRSSKPLKLMHITTVPMTQWFFLRGQNQFMSDRGFEVHATSSAGPYLDQLLQRDPIVAHPVFISRSIRPWQDLGSLARLTVLLLRVRPDIVQVSTSKAALLGSLAAWLTRVPVRIYQIRGLSSESEIGWRRLLFRQLERWTATMCNGHFVNAASLRHHAVRAGILSPHQGFIAGFGMSNGVDVDRFSPTNVMPADLSLYSKPTAERDYTPQDPVIGFVGRITADKGIEDLYAAWQVIRAEFPRSRLLLVGPWEHESAVRNGCRSALEQDPRVVCPGTQLDVAPFYRVMHVLAFPTHGTEGFPNAPMEAAAMGLPVVATRVIGCVDAVVDNVTGKLIEPRQAAQLIQALRDYLSNPELQRQHGTAARERVHAEFRPERLWQEFLGEYCRLLRQAGLPVPTANPTSDMQTRESQSSRQSHAA